MMEAKLLILLFKILICTLFISFKSEGLTVVEVPDQVKELDNNKNSAKSNSFEQSDNIDDQEVRRQIEELEKLMQNQPNPQFEINAEQQQRMQRELEVFNQQRELEISKNQPFGNINADKQMDEMNKLIEDAATIKIPTFDFKVSDDDVNDFDSFKTRRRILHYVAVLLSIVLIITGIARCVKNKTTSSPPSNRRFLLWVTLKKKDSDQDKSSGEGVASEESSGDGVDSQESSGDKTHLIV